MVARAQVLISAVGPYLLYGEPTVAACIAQGTDYVDLCGEPLWMARMIEALGAAAKAGDARILFSCGFDSVPFDLGVVVLQERAIKRFGGPAQTINVRVREAKGGPSGGTIASAMVNIGAAQKDAEIGALMTNPFALTEGVAGVTQPRDDLVFEDPDLGQWVAPFFMATINSKNVHRTNFLLDHRYGTAMRYNEMLVTGPGDAGRAMADAVVASGMMSQGEMPAPGEGPSQEERDAGGYDILFTGEMPNGETIRLVVSGRGDPGYSTTSRIITQAALQLAEQPKGKPAGGIWTPGAALGLPLVKRLQQYAGMRFTFEE